MFSLAVTLKVYREGVYIGNRFFKIPFYFLLNTPLSRVLQPSESCSNTTQEEVYHLLSCIGTRPCILLLDTSVLRCSTLYRFSNDLATTSLIHLLRTLFSSKTILCIRPLNRFTTLFPGSITFSMMTALKGLLLCTTILTLFFQIQLGKLSTTSNTIKHSTQIITTIHRTFLESNQSLSTARHPVFRLTSLLSLYSVKLHTLHFDSTSFSISFSIPKGPDSFSSDDFFGGFDTRFTIHTRSKTESPLYTLYSISGAVTL